MLAEAPGILASAAENEAPPPLCRKPDQSERGKISRFVACICRSGTMCVFFFFNAKFLLITVFSNVSESRKTCKTNFYCR